MIYASLSIIADFTKTLPVCLIPTEDPVAAMRLDVIQDDGHDSQAVSDEGVCAPWMRSEVMLTRLAPAPVAVSELVLLPARLIGASTVGFTPALAYQLLAAGHGAGLRHKPFARLDLWHHVEGST
jgi:hypothetical protein